LHNLEVECLAIAIPESIRVNISEMQIDSVIKVRDLVLPPGVTTKVDPDSVVVMVHPPIVEAEVAPAVTEAAQAEPEVIGRKVAEEAEEEPEK
jgi:large subunit ribosomal protein L25